MTIPPPAAGPSQAPPPTRRHHRLLPAAALGVAAPLLWLMSSPLREQAQRDDVVATLAAAGCPQRDAATIDALLEAERRFGVDPALLIAVAVQESTCRERVVGASGSRGLLQLSPRTARDVARRHGIDWHGAERLYEPEYNIVVGAAHLSELYQALGTWGAALSAYNLGESRYRTLSRRRGGDLTSRYARAVLERRDELERARNQNAVTGP